MARLLDLARDSGLVRISIGTPGGVDVELSDQLRRRLGLTRAIVVNAVDGGDAEIREHLAGLTAELLEEILTPDDVLGLGWSRSALATAARLRRLPPCPVVQLTGALTSPDVSVNLIESVQAVARSGGGRGYTFYSPLFVADPASVDVITRQAEVADAFARFGQVTTAVVGIGSWQPVRSDLHDALTAEERAALQRRDVLADVCGTFLDAAGTDPQHAADQADHRDRRRAAARRAGRHLRRVRPQHRGGRPDRGARRLRHHPRHHRGVRPGTAPTDRRMTTCPLLTDASTASWPPSPPAATPPTTS